MGRDSNPRYLSVHTLSRRAQSTTLSPILRERSTIYREFSVGEAATFPFLCCRTLTASPVKINSVDYGVRESEFPAVISQRCLQAAHRGNSRLDKRDNRARAMSRD